MSRQRWLVCALVLLGVALGAAACGDDNGEVAPTADVGPTATSESTAEPSPTSPETATPSVRRTGIPEVDAVLDAVESGEIEPVVELVRFESIPCEPPGSALEVACKPDEPTGAPVEVVLSSSCEGDLFLRREEIDDSYLGNLRVHAIYQAPPGFDRRFQSLRDGDYVAVFERPTGGLWPTRAFVIDQGEVVQVLPAFIIPEESFCAGTPKDFVHAMGLTEAILPPVEE